MIKPTVKPQRDPELDRMIEEFHQRGKQVTTVRPCNTLNRQHPSLKDSKRNAVQ